MLTKTFWPKSALIALAVAFFIFLCFDCYWFIDQHDKLGAAKPGTAALLEFRELTTTAGGGVIWKKLDFNGAQLKRARPSPMGSDEWRVDIEFTRPGTKKFGELTSHIVGRQIGMFLDGQPIEVGPDGRPVPISEYRGVTVREPMLNGKAEITGKFDKERAVSLSSKINAGILYARSTNK